MDYIKSRKGSNCAGAQVCVRDDDQDVDQRSNQPIVDSAVLKEGIAVKNTLKWLQQILGHERILEIINCLNLQKAVCMEKNKKKHQSKFVYYRLLKGVKNLFAGVKRMFLFRWKQRARKALLKTYPPMLPFLGDDASLQTIDISDNYPQNASMGKIDFPISYFKG